MIILCKVVVISGPAGVGKGTLIKEIMKKDSSFRLSISHTSREMRDYEVDGNDYYFISREQFENLGKNHHFIETANVHGNLYGTARDEIDRLLSEQHNVLMEIDVQGAKRIRELYPESLLIFINPPSWEILQSRLTGRGTESAETLEIRLETAMKELENNDFFDYYIENDDLEKTTNELISLISGGKNA